MTKTTKKKLNDLFDPKYKVARLCHRACRALNYIPDTVEGRILITGTWMWVEEPCGSPLAQNASEWWIRLSSASDPKIEEELFVRTERLLPVLVTLMHDVMNMGSLTDARLRADVISDLEIDMYKLNPKVKQEKMLGKETLTVKEYFSLALARFPLRDPTERLCANVMTLYAATRNLGFVPRHKTPQPSDLFLDFESGSLTINSSAGCTGVITPAAVAEEDTNGSASTKVLLSSISARVLMLAAEEGAEKTFAAILEESTLDEKTIKDATVVMQKSLQRKRKFHNKRKEFMELLGKLEPAVKNMEPFLGDC